MIHNFVVEMDDKPILLDPSLDKQLKGHKNAITALYYSPNEQQIASSSLDNSVLLWDLSGSLRSYRFRGHDEAVMDVTFSPTGKYMASASRDRTVRLWVPTVTGSTGVFKAHSQTVRSIQFSSDGSKLITASDDKIVKLWSSDKYKFISSFVGHTNWVRCARMSADGSIIASCSDDKTTRLWNPDSGELIHTYKDLKGHGLHVAWHPSGCYIAVGTSHGNIKLYDIRTHSLVQYYSIHNEAVTQLAFHPSGSYILTASKDGKMKILDLLEGHPIFTLSGHTGPVNAVNFSLSGETFASGGEDKLVYLWRTNFTAVADDMKENVAQGPSTVPRTQSQNSKLTATSRTQGTRQWYLCYHSNKYPVANFIQINDSQEQHSYTDEQTCGCHQTLQTIHEGPVANSTFETSCSRNRSKATEFESSFLNSSLQRSLQSNSTSRGMEHVSVHNTDCDPECPSNVANHSSFMPHCTKGTCTNATCGSEIRESFPDPYHDSEYPSQNVSHTSHIPRLFRKSIRRTIEHESTPKPDCDLECTSHSFGHASHISQSCSRKTCTNATCINISSPDHPLHNVGHSSHIPRSCPPKPSTYNVPTLIDRTVGSEIHELDDENFFGLIKLKENDVCYTSGTIEWVGRKRCYPINSGFKTLNDFPGNEPKHKKVRRLDNCMNKNVDNLRECDCTDMFPTVNAIVDHLNALHEAVDLIDLRLNTVEDTMSKY